MNPLVQQAIGSILRWALTFVAGCLVNRGIWTGAEAEVYVGSLSIAIVTLGWSFWIHYRSRVRLLTALTMPPGTTENDVKAVIKSGAATPTVTTPPDTVPGIPR